MISGELDRDVFDDALSVSVFIILTKIKYQLTVKTENINQKIGGPRTTKLSISEVP